MVESNFFGSKFSHWPFAACIIFFLLLPSIHSSILRYVNLSKLKIATRQIFKLQETSKSYDLGLGTSFDTQTISSFASSFSSTDIFAISVWVKKISWTYDYADYGKNNLFRVGNGG